MNRRAFLLGAAMVLLCSFVTIALRSFAEATFLGAYGAAQMPWLLIANASGFAVATLGYDVLTRVARTRTVDLLLLACLAALAGAAPALLDAGASPAMLVVVLSGYVGRHLMKQIALEVSEKKELLTRLESAYRETAGELAAHPEQAALVRPWSGFWGRLVAAVFHLFPRTTQPPAAVRAMELAESMADLEYAIKTHETFRWWFGFWLRVHVAASVLMYALLALHIWAGIHYGLRWFT